MRRRLPLLRTVIGLTGAMLVAVAAGLLLGRTDRVVIAAGHLAGGSVAVRSPLDGRVLSMQVDPGQEVKAGQPLLVLETDELENEYERTETRVDMLDNRQAVLRAKLERLCTEVHPAEERKGARALERARLSLASATLRANRLRKLGNDGLVSSSEVEEAVLDEKLAEISLDEAEEAIPELASRHRSGIAELEADLQATEGRATEERLQLRDLKRRLGRATIVAVADGVVVGDDLHELEGRSVREGDVLLRLAVATADRFEGELRDVGRSFARPGLAVKIRLEGYPWLIHGVLNGSVHSVSEHREGREGFYTSISIDPTNPPGPLFEGMKGEARIIVREDVTFWRLLFEKVVEARDP